MVLDNGRMKVREIAETIGISKERVGYILHEELDMKKLCAKWVLRLLTADQKRTRMKISEQCLERFNKNKIDFVHSTISRAVGYADYEGGRYHLNVHTLLPQHTAQRPRRKQSSWSTQSELQSTLKRK